jgi:stage V sporulation protein G
MEITEVRIRKIAGKGKLRAFASITFNKEFVIHDLKVIDGNKGLFVAMPSKRGKDGEYKDIAHPIVTATREAIQKRVLQEYEECDTIAGEYDEDVEDY